MDSSQGKLTVMAGAVEQVPTTRGVQIKKDAWNNNHLLLEASLEEIQAIWDWARQPFKVQPEVESTVRHVFDDEAHVS